MVWACTACSYHNLNKTSSKCHVCQTARTASSTFQPAVIDLTNFCSPKRQSGVMESNRSRRRRLGETSDREGNGGGVKSAGERSAKWRRNETGSDSLGLSAVNGAASENANKECANLNNNDGGSLQHASRNDATNAIASRGRAKNVSVETKSRDASATRNNAQTVFEILSSDDEVDEPLPKALPLNYGTAKSSKSRHDKNSESNSNDARKEPCKSTAVREEKEALRKDASKKPAARKIDTESCSASESNNFKDFKRYKNHSNSYDESKKSNIPSNQQHKDPNKSATNHANNNFKDQKKSCNNKQTNSLTNYYTPPPTPLSTLLSNANALLQKHFGHTTLRPLQQTAIQTSFQRKSQIIIMATGGGKSLCYQLPALVGYGKPHDMVTVVVCPLIALMLDQVKNLRSRGVVSAALLNGSLKVSEKEEVYARLRLDKNKTDKNKKDNGKDSSNAAPIQLLYCTPELIKTERFRGALQKLYEAKRLFQFAIDEAHCVSTWGHDFRVAYKELGWLREAFPEVPVMACTGTATSKVIKDIRQILHLDANSAPCIMGTFNRTNISYEVRFKDSLNVKATDGALADLTKLVQKQHEIADKANEPCSGIVYVHKRDDCVSLASRITKMTGLVCAPYHAGLKDADREDTQRKWTDGSVKIAVATVAFGMGIDLAHVRYVIHWTLAKSLEGFYQESGRGGRDGKPSLSILYYSKDDAEKFAYIIKKKAESIARKKGNRDGVKPQTIDHGMVELEGMIDYCTKPRCRRKHVLEHFGEPFDAKTQCNMTCDFCKNPKKVESETKAAECMSAVLSTQRVMHAGKTGSRYNDKQKPFHGNPLDDESHDDYESDNFLGTDEGLLGITDYTGCDDFSNDAPKTNGFVKASTVLGKYEKMECQEGKKNDFVKFKARAFNDESEEKNKKQQIIEIPTHLRKDAPDPHANSYKKLSQEQELKSRSSYASEAERLQAELDALKKEREAARAKILGSRGGTSKAPSSALSAPSLSFKKRR